MEDKDVSQRPEESERGTRLDAGFRPTGDEEPDVRNPSSQSTYDLEDGRLRAFIHALA
jgi:hypothetical protein